MAAWALWLVLAAQGPVTAREHVDRGYSLAKNGDFARAELELREAVKLAPKDPVALAVLGMVLSQGANPEEANTYLERALALDPKDTGTRYNLAFNQFRLGRMTAARANLEQILREKADHAQAAALLEKVKGQAGYAAALEQYRAGRFAESQAALEALPRTSTDPQALALLAWCHHRQGRPEQAVGTIRKAIEFAPNDAVLYTSAGQILLEEKKSLPAADGAVRKALQLAPDHAPAVKLKGLLELEYGNVKQALASFQHAAELDPADPEAVERVGSAQRMLFQYKEAAATMHGGIAKFPAYARLYEAYGRLLLDPAAPADPKEAARLFEKALALDASLPRAHTELGKLLLDEGQDTDAVKHLEAAARLEPGNSATHLALANAYRMVGRTEEQQRELQKFRELEAAKTP